VALESYRKKRRFDVTPEPRGRRAGRAGHRYVIQKHAARRLHYDLRLELDGVMKSWAVTRGPSLDPGEKRLAVEVEDHPIEYNSFEGTIPEGEYGGGTVMIWDLGSWRPHGDPHKGFAKGHLEFDLDGEKLHGRWHLVRMRARERDSHQNWLLIKGDDEYARGSHDADILEEQPRSAVSDRLMEEITAGKGEKKGKARVWHSGRPAGAARATAASPSSPKAALKRALQQHAAEKESKGKTKTHARRAAKTTAPASGAVALKRSTSARPTEAEAARAPLPDFVPFSLATLYGTAPSGADWLHEIKFDGYRMEARLDHGKVRLLTRKRQDWTHRFEPIAAAVAALPVTTALLDGEIVVEDAAGISNFSLLQTDLKDRRSDRFVYYVFDLLHLDGHDLTGEPLIARKAALERLLKRNGSSGPIRYTPHFDEAGPTILKHACEMGLEGIISKRRNAPYRSGRTDNFVKSKCHGRQEFIVVGFTPSAAEPRAIGALIVGMHENGVLRYAGRVGTGYSHKLARDLWRHLEALRSDRRPVVLPADEKRKDIVWVKPQLVIEAEFAGVTHGGVLRQASFKGLREDKDAKDVGHEVPAAATVPRGSAAEAKVTAARSPAPAKHPSDDPLPARAAKSSRVEIAHVRLTHPDRVYWPDVGVTKTDLAEYYVRVWDWMRPHLVNRALAVVRGPEGTDGELFFQKHIASTIKSSPLRHFVPGKDHDVIAVESAEDLVALVQSGALEIHVRGSRLDSLETCDRIVFDLDPGEGLAWSAMIAAAREIRERLKAEKLESFAKLSGGKGVHVTVPIADADWDTVKTFAARIATRMSADSPRRYLATMTKALRDGRIFIDYFRNSREATSIAPYSTRARPGAPVSVPVTWERLSRTSGGNEFSLLDVAKRIKEDAWADMGKVRQKLPKNVPARRPSAQDQN
jgi:bifunctional non-homologous end joining protein LigD